MKVVKGGNGPTRSNPGLDTNQMQVKVNMNDTEDLVCENCGHKYFTQLMMFKKFIKIHVRN